MWFLNGWHRKKWCHLTSCLPECILYSDRQPARRSDNRGNHDEYLVYGDKLVSLHDDSNHPFAILLLSGVMAFCHTGLWMSLSGEC